MLEQYNDSNYINLATFRKNGKTVETPVWFAQAEDSLYVFSAGNAGKVKRLRNNTQAKIARCTTTGKLLGQWQDVSAQLLITDQEKQIAYQAIRKKYGWQMALLDFFSTIGGKKKLRAFIRIRALSI